jgi:DNA helicase II / ATP-dependent DNA helicase PcrA
MTSGTTPVLDGDAQRALQHCGSHMQIIACAGSAKTEVIALRVADLIAEGVDPAGIIASTFTERAAEELEARISASVAPSTMNAGETATGWLIFDIPPPHGKIVYAPNLDGRPLAYWTF